MLLNQADDNGDGVVEYEEFVPLCFKILVPPPPALAARVGSLSDGCELGLTGIEPI
jgi:hypothetical protein